MGCYCNRDKAREKPCYGSASLDLNASSFFTITFLMLNESSFLYVIKKNYVPSTFFTRTFSQ